MKKDVLGELLDVLQLEAIEQDIYRGRSQDLGWGRIYGGQVLGQALFAAASTVPRERLVHSAHASFLRSGDASRPVVYLVDRIRDGRSFTERRVVAVQEGRAIFHLSASFQVEEPGLDHQDPMPEAPDPETLVPEHILARRVADRLPEAIRRAIPDAMRERFLAERPIEIRPVDPQDPVHPPPRPPHRQAWFRAVRALPDDPALHRVLLAYVSDFHLLVTSLQPHGASWLTPGLQVASLDHAIWFHRPARVDRWLLYDIHSPSASGARGLAMGRFFTRDGVHVATTMQEGLIRDRRGTLNA